MLIEYDGINYTSKYLIGSFDRYIKAFGDRNKINSSDEFIKKWRKDKNRTTIRLKILI